MHVVVEWCVAVVLSRDDFLLRPFGLCLGSLVMNVAPTHDVSKQQVGDPKGLGHARLRTEVSGVYITDK